MSSSHTLDEEIEQFQLEDTERPRGNQFVVLSEEEEATEASGIAGLVVARPEDESEEDMDRMQGLLTKRGAKVAERKTGGPKLFHLCHLPLLQLSQNFQPRIPKRRERGRPRGRSARTPRNHDNNPHRFSSRSWTKARVGPAQLKAGRSGTWPKCAEHRPPGPLT